LLAFAVRTVLESVREDKREDHPGRPDAYFLAMDPTHFEEVFRAERSDLVAISSRLRFPVDARGNVTDGDGHSATPLQACLVLFGRFGCQDDWKTLTPEFDRDRTWCVRCTAVCTHTQSHRARAPRLKKIYHAPGLPGHEELHLTAGGSDRSSHDGARVPVDEARAATEYCLAIVLRNFIVCASGRSEASLMTGIVPPTLDEYIALLRFAPAVLALDAAAAAAAAGV
jgi:hypothetical protein